ncbi:MAG: hypothetical protein K5755_07115 [Clostridiales bacterium]|nr:hypothetical protein [Clostridiales bacterium]
MEFENALQQFLKGMEPALSMQGFSVVVPDGASKELPLTDDGNRKYVEYAGDKGKVRFVYANNLVTLLYTDIKADEADGLDFKIGSQTLFEADNLDEKEIKSLCNIFTEDIEEYYGTKTQARSAKKNIPVSKAAVKSGAMQYDANTLASRLTAAYPDLKEPYKANLEKYGEFYGEEFFVEYAPVIINTIKQKDKMLLKKVFNILNDIYENGSSDVQGLIAVTILGEMNNDEALLATAKEYMCDELRDPVIYINEYFQTAAGKRKREKLNNPPPYKPKKQKKPGFFSQMMAASASQGQPPMPM